MLASPKNQSGKLSSLKYLPFPSNSPYFGAEYSLFPKHIRQTGNDHETTQHNHQPNSLTMRNSVLVSSDLQSVILLDSQQSSNRLAIGKRGVLLSVLGTDICGSEVPAELDNHISNLLKTAKPFYEFVIGDAAKNQLCISYNDANNVVFIIGITDIDVALAAPTQIKQSAVTTFAVKLKENPSSGLASRNVILARLETTGSLATSKKSIKFYHLPAM